LPVQPSPSVPANSVSPGHNLCEIGFHLPYSVLENSEDQALWLLLGALPEAAVSQGEDWLIHLRIRLKGALKKGHEKAEAKKAFNFSTATVLVPAL
jgi:hypothetical protein